MVMFRKTYIGQRTTTALTHRPIQTSSLALGLEIMWMSNDTVRRVTLSRTSTHPRRALRLACPPRSWSRAPRPTIPPGDCSGHRHRTPRMMCPTGRFSATSSAPSSCPSLTRAEATSLRRRRQSGDQRPPTVPAEFATSSRFVPSASFK